MKSILLFFSFAITFSIQAQRFDWSTSAGYPGVANSYLGTVDLATDQEGNAYVMDYANTRQVCQGDTIELASSGYNLFLYKFNPEGDLIWGRAFGPGPGGATVKPLNLEFGPDNNLYALVNINANNIITQDSTYIISGPDNLILSINENGTINWINSIQFSCPTCLLLEIANDRIYYQAGQTLIKSMEFDQTPDTNFSFYYDSQTAISTLPFQGSAVFSNGDILLAGLHRGDASFIEGDTLVFDGNAGLFNNIAYVRLTSDFEPIWSKSFGYLHDPETHFIPVDIDANNQIYTGWEVLDSITIAGTTVLGDFNLWAGTLLSMDENGNPLWLRELQSSAALRINYLFADQETNKVWLTGISSSPTTVGDSIIIPGVNGSPILASVSPAGEFSSQTSLNQLPGGSQGKTIGKASSGQLYLGGNLNNGSNYSINCVEYPGNKGLYLSSFLDVPQNPPTPTIDGIGGQLSATPSFEGNIQWFLEGTAIEGANEQTYQASIGGNYSVVYSYDFGCTGTASSSIFFVETGIQKQSAHWVKVYPNPANNELHLVLPAEGEFTATIHSLTGQLVKEISSNSPEIQVQDLQNGVYLLQINQHGKLYQRRFSKMN